MNHSNLWAPWRMAYLRSIADLPQDPEATPKNSNFFRTYWASPQDDELNLVVHRTAEGMILLNRYPYANGHLLIALGDPAPTLADYDSAQRQTFWTLVDTASRLVRNCLNPQGLNIGVNEGTAAGAGVPEHLHAHVVPRWGGDTNFMTTLGGVRVSPDALESVASAYRESIENGALDA